MASHSLQHRNPNYNSHFKRWSENAKVNLRRGTRDIAVAGKTKQWPVRPTSLSQDTLDEYKSDIIAHMHHLEYRTMPDASCINALQDSFWTMRFRLLEFIVQIHKAFELPEEALFLSVNLLDRYCCCIAIADVDFQLVGCTALLIAAKYEVSSRQETPSLKELESACCFFYSIAMFKEMEWSILKALDWAVGHPVAYTFLRMALAECTRDCQLEHLSMYIAEIALFYKEFACVIPSTLATAALALASHILRPTASSLTYVYDPHVFVNLLRRLYQPPQVLVAKYASKQLSNVSAIVLKFLQPQVFTGAGGDTSNAEPKILGDK